MSGRQYTRHDVAPKLTIREQIVNACWDNIGPPGGSGLANRTVCGPPDAMQSVISRSLVVLQKRRQEILSQLEKGYQAAISRGNQSDAGGHNSTPSSREICSKSVSGKSSYNANYPVKVTEERPTNASGFASTYSHWASEYALSTGFSSSNKGYVNANGPSNCDRGALKNGHNADKCIKRLNSPAEDDQFIPFDPPVVSKYGPISRASKTILRPSNPIQASSPLGGYTVSTPVVRKPVPATVASPMPTWYNGGPGQGNAPHHHHTGYGVQSAQPGNGMGDIYPTSVSTAAKSAPNKLVPAGWQPPTGTTPVWTANHVTDQENMKLELRKLDHKINKLKEKSDRDHPDDDDLANELAYIEQCIRDAERDLKLRQILGWENASNYGNEWKRSQNSSLASNGNSDEEVYELQVAQDMQEAEKRWLHELEEDEPEWLEERDDKKDADSNRSEETSTDIIHSEKDSHAE